MLTNKKQICIDCRLPRAYYDLKFEPSPWLLDYDMPRCCQGGHHWVTWVPELGNQND